MQDTRALQRRLDFLGHWLEALGALAHQIHQRADREAGAEQVGHELPRAGIRDELLLDRRKRLTQPILNRRAQLALLLQRQEHIGVYLVQPASQCGEEGAHLLDMAPTLLELGGYDVPDSMQGRSLVADHALRSAAMAGYSADGEEIVRDRLSGLGYI